MRALSSQQSPNNLVIKKEKKETNVKENRFQIKCLVF